MEIIAGRFHVDRWLGEGSLGHLYLVEQQGTSLRNTIRVLPLHHPSADSPPPASLVAGKPVRIRHPNLSQVSEVGKTPEGLTYILMDHATGTLLAEVVARGAVPLRWAVEIVRQMIAGIRAAHEAGALHGALTPESVVIGSTEDDTLTVRILDLGLSALFHVQGCLPDPRYASPEVLTGAAPDERSDIFSLGAVAYHLMTGTPFGTPEPNQIPEAVSPVLATALERLPEKRFQTVAQLAEALGHAWAEPASIAAAAATPGAAPHVPTAPVPALFDETASSPPKPGPTAEVPKPDRPVRRLRGAGLMVAAVGLLLVWLYGPGKRPTQQGTMRRSTQEGTASRPLRIAPEDSAAGTQSAKLPSPSRAGTKSSETPSTAPRRIVSPTLLPGQGYKAGLTRDESPPADVDRSPEVAAPSDTETASNAATPNDTGSPGEAATPAAVPEVEAEPAAAPTAEAAMAEARAAAARAVNSYASAIEANDLDAIGRADPGLTEHERAAWQEFFAATRDLKAQLTVKDVKMKDGVAEAQVSGVYEYANRSLNRSERKPVSFRALLTRGPEGWRLSEVR
jgi:serine/threonine protein kinase